MAERTRSGPLSRPVLSLAVLLAFATLLSLGAWQLQRLQWKRDLLARVESARSAAPAPLGDLLRAARRGEDVTFRRAVTTCPADGAPRAEFRTSEEGAFGRRLVHACALIDAPFRSLLIVHRFLADATVLDLVCMEPAGPPRTVVELRRGGRGNAFTPADQPEDLRFFRLDIPAIAGALQAAGPAPYAAYLVSTPDCANHGGGPEPQISNNHLGYALTWFGLAAALLGVYAAMLRRPRSPD